MESDLPYIGVPYRIYIIDVLCYRCTNIDVLYRCTNSTLYYIGIQHDLLYGFHYSNTIRWFVKYFSTAPVYD